MRRLLAPLLGALALSASFAVGRALPPEPAAAAVWETIGALERPRAYAHAVTLSTGEVLVVGGLDRDDPEVTSYRSELVEPATGRVTLLPQPLLGRLNQTVTVGWGGRVAVIGGTEWRRTYWAAVDRVEVFIPDSRTWLRGAPLPTARSDHGTVALPDGRLIVTGGNRGTTILASTEVYDLAQDRWTKAAAMPEPRTRFGIAGLPDGTVLVTGGLSERGVPLATSLLYDPRVDRWSTVASLATPRVQHSLVVLPNGDVLVIGGQLRAAATAERYDWRLRRFVPAGALVSPRLAADAVGLADGRVILVGGAIEQQGRVGWPPTGAAEIWEPLANTWTLLPSAMQAGAQNAVVVTEAGIILLGGLGARDAAHRSIERLVIR